MTRLTQITDYDMHYADAIVIRNQGRGLARKGRVEMAVETCKEPCQVGENRLKGKKYG